MRTIREGAHIVFSVLDPSFLEETVALACTVYSQREPMALALGLTPEELRPYVESCVEEACYQELGVVALERESGCVVGFSLAKDYLTPLQWKVTERLAPMHELFQALEQGYLGEHGSPGESGVFGHELMTGIAAEHPYQRTRRATIAPTLGYELMALRTGLLGARGYQQAIAISTEPRAQQIHECLGAHRLCSISYEDFITLKDRQRPFASMSGRSCALMLKDLREGRASLAKSGRVLRGPVALPSSSSARAHVLGRRVEGGQQGRALPDGRPEGRLRGGDDGLPSVHHLVDAERSAHAGQ